VTQPQQNMVTDASERAKALDVSRSFIVQAPAGSGKTELLIQRILALLAVAESPEEILAITFTRKAAAEMRLRLLESFDRAQLDEAPAERHKCDTWERARLVLERDRERGWSLQENPSRLQIMTIDSFCSALSRRMPWLARLGDQPAICEDAEELYNLAAENLLARLETDDSCSPSISYMLAHLDNRSVQLRQLLVAMLARRDQWIRHIIDEKGSSRSILEAALGDYVADVVASTRNIIGSECHELMQLARYACDNLEESGENNPLAVFADYTGDLSEEASYPQWQALANLLLTGSGLLRKRADKKIGFPPGPNGNAAAMKERMQALLSRLQDDDRKTLAIQQLRGLPSPAYSPQQWQALESLIDLLPLAVIELREVFKSVGQVDFVEVAGSARAALGSIDLPGEMLLQLDSQIRHILVDEYQDTSYTQYALLQSLTSGWQPGDGRTLFAVGDPMQSIYRFREADVGLFLKTARDGLENVTLDKLTLSCNFRSQAGLVAWFNRVFSGRFPAVADILTGAVPYEEADAVLPERKSAAVTCHFTVGRNDTQEAEQVLAVVQSAAANNPDESVAVLVRSRSHLLEIIRLFNHHGVRFLAQDVDPLSDRSVAHDLVALTRALLHPGDAVSWYSVLRAPWCGLQLDDLLTLTDERGREAVFERIFREPSQVEMFATLSPDGRQRLERIRPILIRATQARGRVGLRRLVESTWLLLGGPAVVDAAGLEDAEQVFALLEKLDCGGDLEKFQELERGVDKLYASPDPDAGTGLHVMTIHKAKGLEFDTVILPGLGRTPRRDDKSLLRWIEHPVYGLLLAPVPPAGADEDEIYQAVGRILKSRDEHETLRLFYVAATRAKKQLVLLGHLKENDEPGPESGSLLGTIWDSLSGACVALPASPGEVTVRRKKAFITRLPSGWQMPAMAASVQSAGQEFLSATEMIDTGQYASRSFSLRSEEGRLVGTIVHNWLERLAMQGASVLTGHHLDAVSGRVRDDLSRRGLPQNRLDKCVEKVMVCLRNSLTSEKGQWILRQHQQHACEMEISGLVDNTLLHASVDRTFIDDDVRWVIDYKTSSPDRGETLATFLERELEHYRQQVMSYVTLYSQLEPERRVKGGLYFPAVDAWQVVVD